MPPTLEPIRAIELAEVRDARTRIAKTILRTPLIRLELGPDFPDIRLKLENLQPINAYKLRGAANSVAMLSESERKRGVWTISAGNAGQGVAYAARQAGVPCTVVVIETAPESKIERMRALGAKLIPVPYDLAWKALEERSYPRAEGTFVHPFDDHNFIAGHGTMGLEILEDAPETAAVIASIGGGGLITGVGSTIKALKPEIKIFGVEPETAAPAALSFAKGSPQVFTNFKQSFVDGAGLHRRQLGRNEESDAIDGRESANHFRRRRRSAGGGCLDRKSRQRSDRRDRLWWQHRHEKVLRADWHLSQLSG